ncbi:Alcohol dehydrogenase superfamily, zinc-type [Pleurostoma richardsiae]|uniref:Alcohol dehydrogenase superfamily, zinc-type n=1 Tax=Pleurostoma richardsiae TaxID=41990 RepID=A0AA38RN77_9PEZI|nr:Alcohol dehydrogenase superfamily, zinc-type [Pleurostoma richardsiae]
MVTRRRLTTKAYVVDKVGAPFVLRDVVVDEILPDEVLVDIKYTGFCHTDAVVQSGGMPVNGFPVVLGHEGAGVVRQVGSAVADKSLKPGDTVLLSFNTCGECDDCRAHHNGSCHRMAELNFINKSRPRAPYSLPDGTPVQGQFFGQSSLSKLAIAAEKSIVKVDAKIEDLAYLAPLGCGYLTGAGTVFNILRPDATQKLAVIGLGAVGLAAMLAAKVLGVQAIIAVDILEKKLETAKQLGATHVINSGVVTDLNEGIRQVYPDGVDFILDTTGVETLLTASVAALAHNGTLALVGVSKPTANIEVNAMDLLMNEKRVVGVIEGDSDPQQLIPQLAKLYEEGKFPIDKIAKVYDATALDQVIEDLKKGTVVKPVLSWDKTN